MQSYKKLVQEVLDTGRLRQNRTGTDTISTFDKHWEHNMTDGLPALTTKKINIRACIYELLWFLRGDTNIKYLRDHGIRIWDAWAKEDGSLGPVYGKQWRDSGPKHVDQVDEARKLILNDPYSRRIIIDAWCPSEQPEMTLPPCHVLYQFYVEPELRVLNLSVYMRSADLFLGVPFDILEGGLFLSLMARVTGYTPGRLHYTFCDCHIYVNHIEQLKIQLARDCYELPTLKLPYKKSLFDYDYEDFEITRYLHHDFIKGEVAV